MRGCITAQSFPESFQSLSRNPDAHIVLARAQGRLRTRGSEENALRVQIANKSIAIFVVAVSIVGGGCTVGDGPKTGSRQDI